ncbi:uncharacterized protein LOC123689025 [Harmonia axyridis]|uniref:uncharacterized protein LOC123689025 n=1 Tax=Harmonia axyridis TaxID=115357 RepID=UPI001E278688|nr:uncharacterized protein LOC123689025 [Harmonia axyridis]
MDSENNNAYRNCFLCLFICVGLGIWFFLRMIHNRKKLNRNMELIGHQLKEMEDRIRQSIGQGEESQLEEELNDSEMGITELLNQLKELEEEEMKRKLEQQEEFKSDDCEEEPAKDKKND